MVTESKFATPLFDESKPEGMERCHRKCLGGGAENAAEALTEGRRSGGRESDGFHVLTANVGVRAFGRYGRLYAIVVVRWLRWRCRRRRVGRAAACAGVGQSLARLVRRLAIATNGPTRVRNPAHNWRDMDLRRRLGNDVINLSSHGDVLNGKTREVARATTPPCKAMAVAALSIQPAGA